MDNEQGIEISSSSDSPLSNTVPPKDTAKPKIDFKELHKGIDSLYMSFWGTLKPCILEELSEKKLSAQSHDINIQANAVKVINEHNFEIMDKGRGKYGYVLIDNWFHMQICSKTITNLPTVYVQISSEVLNGIGITEQ